MKKNKKVFQSSKFEPVNDASTSYVVLNNVDRSKQVVPQTNLLPGFLNTNSSHDGLNGCNPYFGSLNGPHPQAIIQQSEPSNIFSLIQTLPEIENTAVRAPTNQFQKTMALETSSNIVSPVKTIVQSVPFIENSLKSNSENFISQKWLENSTHLKKVENDNSSFSTTMNSFVNDHNFSDTNYSDFFKEQNSRPEIKESTSKHKVQIGPRNIKRKNSSLTFSQIGLKIMCKNMFQKALKPSELQNVFLESSNSETDKFCELLTESTLKKPSDPFASIIRNDTNCSMNSEFQNSRDIFEIPKLNTSDPHNSLSSTVKRLESRKSVNLSSTKLPFNTPSFGSSLYNVSTNVLVPIIQTKPNKNTSRPTNRVLPMQSFQKPADTSKPKKKYLINENVQSLTPHEAEIIKDITSAEKEFEYIKQIKDVSEAEKSGNKADSSINYENYMETEVTEHNATNILGNQKSVEKKICSLNFGKKENILDRCDSVETVSNSSNNDFSEKTAYIGIQKCNKDTGVGKKKHEMQPIFKEEICKMKLGKSSDQEDIFQDDLDNFKQTQTFKGSNSPLTEMRGQFESDQQSNLTYASQKLFKAETAKKSTESYLIFEIQSEDGFSYKSKSISDVWEKVFEAVQSSRRAHGLPFHPIESFSEICGVKILGLKTNALKYLIEQLPGTEKCQKYTPRYHENGSPTVGNVCTTHELLLNTNNFASARCKPFGKRSSYDMFSWLASIHREQPKQIFVQPSDTELIARRCTANLPMAMKYRTLKETCKHNVGVFRSLIHGRGLFCIKDMEAVV